MANRISIPLNCGECLFFNDLINQTDNFTCKTGGILHYNTPCESFCINTNGLTLINTPDNEFLQYIRKVPTGKLNQLAALLVQEGYNRAEGWSIGDIAYYNLGKSEAISSYVQVIFKGIAGNMGLGIIESVRSPKGEIWTGMVELKYLIKEKDWPAKHKELLSNGKIKDDAMYKVIPNYSYPPEEKMILENYKPANIMDALMQIADELDD